MRNYETRPVKRKRSTKAEIAELEEAIAEAVDQDKPVTVRGVFYRVVSMGALEKTDAAYKRLCQRLKNLRETHEIPYSDIIDGTRSLYRTTSYGSAQEALDNTARTYRQQLWSEQDDSVIFVSEKDAISGIVSPITRAWQVEFLVVRGYSSLSANYDTADEINDRLDAGKNVYVYQLGDHDASGVDAWRAFEDSVGDMLYDQFLIDDDDAERVCFQRIAVTEEQIDELGLQSRPQKRTDTRAAAWGNRPNVEVDAIPANTLRDLVENTITSHIDDDALRITRETEQAERSLLLNLELGVP